MTPLITAARAIDLVENEGYTPNKAALLLKVTDQTIHNILDGTHGWAERINQPVVRAYLAEQKAAKQIAWGMIEDESLIRAFKKLRDPNDKSSFSQLILGGAVAHDKRVLAAGEPTQITANLDVQVLEAGDKLAALLANALTAKSKSIDVSSNQTDK